MRHGRESGLAQQWDARCVRTYNDGRGGLVRKAGRRKGSSESDAVVVRLVDFAREQNPKMGGVAVG